MMGLSEGPYKRHFDVRVGRPIVKRRNALQRASARAADHQVTVKLPLSLIALTVYDVPG